MRVIVFIFFILLALFPSTFGQQEKFAINNKHLSFDAVELLDARIPPSETPIANQPVDNIPILLTLSPPETHPNDRVISHTGYSFLYSETHEQASWVAYELTQEKTRKIFERTDKFLTDPFVLTGTSTHTDYRWSGYDRGHLAPAADMAWAGKAMAESFYYSNISPQNPGFNRGIWNRMERLVRTWAMEHHAVYIVTGPVLSEGLAKIGANQVSVPAYFYKVVLDYREPDLKGIGFIFPNTGSKKALQHFAVSIDSVERFTAINFFPFLGETQEHLLEKTLCIACWSWKSVK
jgi:endonuclease G